MTRDQYIKLQDLLSKEIKYNEYLNHGLFTEAEGYREGLQAARRILEDFYHNSAKEDEVSYRVHIFGTVTAPKNCTPNELEYWYNEHLCVKDAVQELKEHLQATEDFKVEVDPNQ